MQQKNLNTEQKKAASCNAVLDERGLRGIKVSGVDPSQLKTLAKNEHNLWCYNGYEGSFTGWLVPYVEPGDAVRIIDSDYPMKGGLYYVTGTEISFSKEGGKRTVSLGRRLDP